MVALVSGSVPAQMEDGYFVALIVSSIDGEAPTTRIVNTIYGKKQILVDTFNTKTDRAPSHKRIKIDMAPCMRYFVVGRKSAATSLR